MKKVIIKISHSELQTLFNLIKEYRLDESSDMDVMVFFILSKVYRRIFTMLLAYNPDVKNKDKKFTVKQAEAVALRLFLNKIYASNFDDYSKNVALRIINTINQQLS